MDEQLYNEIARRIEKYQADYEQHLRTAYMSLGGAMALRELLESGYQPLSAESVEDFSHPTNAELAAIERERRLSELLPGAGTRGQSDALLEET